MVVRLDEICKLNMGQSPDSSTYNKEQNGLPFFQGNADFGEYYPNVRLWCSQPIKKAQAGDILISVRAPIGALNFANCDCCIGRGLASLTANDDRCLQKYLWYVLESKVGELNSKGTGSTFKAISKSTLCETEFILPSINEQHKIAAVLDKVSDLIAKRRQQLDKLDLLVKARFVEMFGDTNLNNKGWDIKPLGELCTIVRGGSPRPIEQYLGGDIPWIKIGDATDEESIYLHSTKEHIIQDGVKKSRLVKSGSLIFANCGVSLGFARIITFEGCIHDGWLAMEDIDICLDKVFLLQALNQMTQHFREIAPAGTQPNLNTAIMKAYMQIIPPIELQREFVDYLIKINKSKTTITQSLEKLEILKQALMQEYFGADGK